RPRDPRRAGDGRRRQGAREAGRRGSLQGLHRFRPRVNMLLEDLTMTTPSTPRTEPATVYAPPGAPSVKSAPEVTVPTEVSRWTIGQRLAVRFAAIYFALFIVIDGSSFLVLPGVVRPAVNRLSAWIAGPWDALARAVGLHVIGLPVVDGPTVWIGGDY